MFIWFMIVFIGLGGGGGLIKDGLDRCTWIGDFVSREGTVTRTGVELRDEERVSRADPMAGEIADVRLHDDPRRPVAYPTDGPR